MELLLNPIIIAVVILLGLCLLKFNVILSLIVATLAVGLLSGMSIEAIVGTFLDGMAGNSEAALSYVLLGAVAVTMEKIGLSAILSTNLAGVIKGGKIKLIVMLIIMGALSQTLIPVHIAFIPIIIPTLLGIMNSMKLDRRIAACTLAFSMKTTYVVIPVGFGLIFHGIISKNMSMHGMEVATGDVWKAVWILGLGMIVGLIGAYINYRKPREYKNIEFATRDIEVTEEYNGGNAAADSTTKLNKKHYIAIGGAACTLVVQLMTDSMVLGAFAGLVAYIVLGVIPWKKMDEIINEGVVVMGYMAFVMLCAAGFGAVINASGNIDLLVSRSIELFGASKFLMSIAMLLLGLAITIGTGSSFGTVPILAALYVPFAIQVGFSVPATIVLIAGAATIGDAGSPASDMTLGPTSGLNADGQHDHIWDTTVPTFIYFVIPSFVFSLIGAMLF